MSMMLEQILQIVKREFSKITDFRRAGKISYPLSNVLLDNLLLYILQFESFRQFKSSYDRMRGTIKEARINISTSQQKAILDRLDPGVFRNLYKKIFSILQRSKILERYAYYKGAYLMLIDGSGYYSSGNVKCSHCLIRDRLGVTNYQHQALQPFIVHPEQEVIIPLMPEEISNGDGRDKQDCERNAAKRALKLFRQDHPKLKTILVGDGIYSAQPFIELLKSLHIHFILGAKPSNHKIMFEDIEGLRVLGGVETLVIRENGTIHNYEWCIGVMLNGNKDAVKVNYLGYSCSHKGTITYKNSWVTDFEISKSNVKKLVAGGRSRWKCENEGFNNLKNQGYHLGHNYGHGKEHLAFNNYVLNVLSFLIHRVCELRDRLFKQCGNKLGKKELIWQKIRDYIETIIFNTWEGIFTFLLNPVAIPATVFGNTIPPPAEQITA